MNRPRTQRRRNVLAASLLLTGAVLAAGGCNESLPPVGSGARPIYSDGATSAVPSPNRGARESEVPYLAEIPLLTELHLERDSGAARPYDELVILERGETGVVTGRVVTPGCGEMRAVIDGVTVRLQPARTDVSIDVVGPIASATLQQTFENPSQVPFDATYLFPLPADAAVHDFVLTIGNRHIRGIVRERAEARRIFEAARAQGYTASLLSQSRPNVFAQSVANIAPRTSLDVTISYLDPVDVADGWNEVAFPMVVGPRYWPVGARDAEDRGEVSWANAAAYRRNMSLTVTIDGMANVGEVESPSDRVAVEARGGALVARLVPDASRSNVDFRLRWRHRDSVLASRATRQGDFSLVTLTPPRQALGLRRRGVDHTFLLDVSGSMQGRSIDVMKDLMHEAVDGLGAGDTFTIASFSDRVQWLSDGPMRVHRRSRRAAHDFIDDLRARGGTEMLPAIERVIGRASASGRAAAITFMSDGQVGNEAQILRRIQGANGRVRFFPFAVGGSPNLWLMGELARQSGGALTVSGVDANAGEALAAHFGRVAAPVATNLEVLVKGAAAESARPIPHELLAGRPLHLPIRLDGAGSEVTVVATADVDGRRVELLREVLTPGTYCGARGTLGKVWARERLGLIADEARVVRDPRAGADLAAEAVALAESFGLVSDVTSLVAVDSLAPVSGRSRTRIGTGLSSGE